MAAARSGPCSGAATTHAVDYTVDADDASPGARRCADRATQCTVRAAITEPDTDPRSDGTAPDDLDKITFKLPLGQYEIAVGDPALAPLPAISDPMNISAFPAADGAPDVEIKSGDTSVYDPPGLSITAGGWCERRRRRPRSSQAVVRSVRGSRR